MLVTKPGKYMNMISSTVVHHMGVGGIQSDVADIQNRQRESPCLPKWPPAM